MSLYWLWSYLIAFWSTVVVNCAKPVNWDNCWPPQDWLAPSISDYIRARQHPYSEERKILESVERSNGRHEHEMDDRRTDSP
jgi:hypothetical protein